MTDASTLEEFRRAVRALCGLTWDEMMAAKWSEGSLLCLEAQLVLSLLTTGYGFDDQSWAGLHFVKQVGDNQSGLVCFFLIISVGQIAGADVGWTMGYMTERTNRIAEKNASALLGLPVFVTLAVLFCLLLLVGLLLSYHAGRIRRSSRSYSRFGSAPQLAGSVRHTYGSLSLSL